MKSVLFIEDEEFYRARYGGALEQVGYEVLYARNGEEALELLQGRVFDVIIVDLIMPHMSGLEFLRQLPGTAKEKSKIYVLTVLSGEADQMDVKKIVDAEFLWKEDMTPPDLAERILRDIGDPNDGNEVYPL